MPRGAPPQTFNLIKIYKHFIDIHDLLTPPFLSITPRSSDLLTPTLDGCVVLRLSRRLDHLDALFSRDEFAVGSRHQFIDVGLAY